MRMHFSATLILSGALFASVAHADTTLMQVVGVRAGDTLNVRTGPGATYRDIGDLQPGEVIRVLGFDGSGNWAQMRYRGQIAYVSSKYLRKTSQTGDAPLGTGPHYVTGIKPGDPDGGLVVRDGAGRGAARIGVLRNGAGVHVIQRSANGRWAMIPFAPGMGWVSTTYLKSGASGVQTALNPAPAPQTAPDGGLLPAMFRVTGVAAGDSLNMRDAPNVSGAIIGRFAPGAQVQVLGMVSRNWAHVTDGENAGYISVRYLTRASGGGGATTQNGFVLGITCHGTEPFWTFDIATDRTVTYTHMMGAAPVARLVQTTPSSSTGGYPFTFFAPPYAGSIEMRHCSDGMSDTLYSMSLVLNAPAQSGGTDTLFGCCNLQP